MSREAKATQFFLDLIGIVEKLRAPDGCPWDKEQTHESLLPYFLEEAYEVIESIELKDWETLKEELGDQEFNKENIRKILEDPQKLND